MPFILLFKYRNDLKIENRKSPTKAIQTSLINIQLLMIFLILYSDLPVYDIYIYIYSDNSNIVLVYS